MPQNELGVGTAAEGMRKIVDGERLGQGAQPGDGRQPEAYGQTLDAAAQPERLELFAQSRTRRYGERRVGGDVIEGFRLWAPGSGHRCVGTTRR